MNYDIDDLFSFKGMLEKALSVNVYRQGEYTRKGAKREDTFITYTYSTSNGESLDNEDAFVTASIRINCYSTDELEVIKLALEAETLMKDNGYYKEPGIGDSIPKNGDFYGFTFMTYKYIRKY